MLSFFLIVSRHARRFVLLPASRLSFHHRHSQPSKSHQIIYFADPHPLTLLESYLFKNSGGRGHSLRPDLRIAALPQLLSGDPDPVGTFRRSDNPSFRYHVISLPPYLFFSKPFSCNTYGSPRKCCKQKTYGLANPFRCNTYKKPGGGVIVN